MAPSAPIRGRSSRNRQIRFVVDFTDAAWNTAATHTLFTIAGGMVTDAKLFIRTVEALTSDGSATLAAGVVSDTDTFYAVDDFTDRGATAGAVWIPAGSESTEPVMSDLPAAQAMSEDVVLVIGAAALTGGQLEFVLDYKPMGGVTVDVGTGAAP